MKLLDTNTIIHFLKGDPEVVARLLGGDRAELAIAVITVFELEVGTLRSAGSKRRTILEQGLRGIEQIPFDSAAALEAATIRVDLQSRGASIGPLDTLIAGTAMSRRAVLVTDNVREFSRIKGLRIESWRSATRHDR